MSITAETTPNPKAMKFTLGAPLGFTMSATEAEAADSRLAPLFEIPGVASVFATADFVTVTSTQEGSWDTITPEVITTLTAAFDQ